MKNILLILLLVSQITVYAQNGWFIQYNSNLSDIQDLHFINSNTGWAVGYSGTILKTTNGGDNWTSNNISTGYQLSSVRFIDENIGFAAGFIYEGEFLPVLFRTTDGGLSWNISFQLFGVSGTMRNIWFIDKKNGFFGVNYYGNGYIYKTTNAGENWNLVSTNLGNGYFISNIYFTHSQSGYISFYKIVSQNIPIVNKIIKSSDAGSSWFELHKDTVPYSNTNFNRKILFLNDSIGYLQRGDLYKTTNGGTNFFSTASGFINSYSFPDKDTGWCTGYNGKILKTTDGANSWTSQYINSDTDLFPVFFIDSKTGWAGGYIRNNGGGLIIKTYSDGINSVNIGKSSEYYSLFQNYPNPFNPGTKIQYDLQKNNFVTIKVYNILGKEIETLVNEFKNAGSYTLLFDGSKLSSGIYYYKIEAGTYESMMKMMLIK